MAGRLSVALVWIPTDANTADCPTRDRPAEVEPAPPWLASIYSRSGMPTPFSQETSKPPAAPSNPLAAPSPRASRGASTVETDDLFNDSHF